MLMKAGTKSLIFFLGAGMLEYVMILAERLMTDVRGSGVVKFVS